MRSSIFLVVSPSDIWFATCFLTLCVLLFHFGVSLGVQQLDGVVQYHLCVCSFALDFGVTMIQSLIRAIACSLFTLFSFRIFIVSGVILNSFTYFLLPLCIVEDMGPLSFHM